MPDNSNMPARGLCSLFGIEPMPGNSDAADLVYNLKANPEVVFVAYADGTHTLLKGEDRLKEIVDGGKAQKVNILAIEGRSLDEAEVISAAMQIIDEGEFGPVQLEGFQHLLARARNMH
jgi:hypothetical protein